MPPDFFDPDHTIVATGDWLPGYEITSLIGVGGSGKVFQARQLKLDRMVAVKVIRIDKLAQPMLAARFESEAVTLAKFHHPNIVQVYDYGYQEDRLFIAMELLEGEDLGQRIKRTGPLDESTTWAIVRQAASALNYANGLGVVHRDIKPANLFLVPAPSGIGLPRDVPLVRVADFGLALTKLPHADPEGRMTVLEAVVGTPAFMAPEQFRASAEIDHRVDIYGLGATAFHALTGRPPFEGPTPWDVMTQKLEKQPNVRPAVSRESLELLDAMMAADPSRRIASYDELIERIEYLLSFLSMATTPRIGEPPPGAVLKRPTQWRYAALTAGVMAICSAAVYVARNASIIQASPLLSNMERYQSIGGHQALFNSESIAGWLPPTAGGSWRIESDDEGARVLVGTGFTRRTIPAFVDYRITIGLDVFHAATAEVHFAIPAKLSDNARRLVLRVSKNGATLGWKKGDKGTFESVGAAVPFPNEERFKESRPYLEVRITRAGNVWTVSFDGKEHLLGRVPDDGSPKLPEIRLFADGGAARVDSVILEQLQPINR